jgi:SAM-dependent methyltransferase
MNLQKYNLSPDQLQHFINTTAGYQPYILDDNTQVAGRSAWPPPTPEYKWFYEQKAKSNATQIKHWGVGSHMIMDRTLMDVNTWNLMTAHNNSLRVMFNDFIKLAVDATAEPELVIEIGCNDGGLLLSALENGCKKAIGYDFESNHSKVFNLLKEVTKFDISFINEGYNSLTHTMAQCEPADIVIANAVLCHLSDPLNFIKYLSTVTKKTLLISCGVHQAAKGEMNINFHGKPKNYGYTEFPDAFTHHTTISYDLFIHSLKECGFKEIYEINHNDSYPNANWYYGQHKMGFIATK